MSEKPGTALAVPDPNERLISYQGQHSNSHFSTTDTGFCFMPPPTHLVGQVTAPLCSAIPSNYQGLQGEVQPDANEMAKLQQLCDRWRDLGRELQVKSIHLDAFSSEHYANEGKLAAMLKYYMENHSGETSVTLDIFKAILGLRDERLAEEFARIYLPEYKQNLTNKGVAIEPVVTSTTAPPTVQSEIMDAVKFITGAPAPLLSGLNASYGTAGQPSSVTYVPLNQFKALIPDCGGLYKEGFFKSCKLCPKPRHSEADYDAKYVFCISDINNRRLPVFIAAPYSVKQVSDVKSKHGNLVSYSRSVGEFKESIERKISIAFNTDDVEWCSSKDLSKPLEVRDVFAVVESGAQDIMPKIAYDLSYQSELKCSPNEYYLLMMRRSAGTDWQTDIMKVKSADGRFNCSDYGHCKYYEMSAKSGKNNYFEVKSFDSDAEVVFGKKVNKSLQYSLHNKITVLFATIKGSKRRRIAADGGERYGCQVRSRGMSLGRGLVVTSGKCSDARYEEADVSSDTFSIIGLQQLNIYPCVVENDRVPDQRSLENEFKNHLSAMNNDGARIN